MSTTFLVGCIALGLSVLLSVWCCLFAYRLKKLTLGKNGSSLEDTIIALDTQIKSLKIDHAETLKKVIELQAKMQTSARLSGMVKFNALPDLGGNQSFALAMLDEQKCGYVITLLAVRERIQLFAKRIEGGSSDQELIPEEKSAIKNALAHA